MLPLSQQILPFRMGLLKMPRRRPQFAILICLLVLILGLPFLLVTENPHWDRTRSLNLSDYVRPEQNTNLIYPSALQSFVEPLEVSRSYQIQSLLTFPI